MTKLLLINEILLDLFEKVLFHRILKNKQLKATLDFYSFHQPEFIYY